MRPSDRNWASPSGSPSIKNVSMRSPTSPAISSGFTSTSSGPGSKVPTRATIAHGFLTLSLIPALSKENYRIDNARMGINYGLNRVRFLAPVPAGSRVRLRSELVEAKKVDETTVDLTVRQTVELDGSTKPAAVAEVIARMIY